MISLSVKPDNITTWDYLGWKENEVLQQAYKQEDWNNRLMTEINKASNKIFQSVDSGINRILVNPHVTDIIFSTLPYYTPTDKVLSSKYWIQENDLVPLDVIYLISEDADKHINSHSLSLAAHHVFRIDLMNIPRPFSTDMIKPPNDTSRVPNMKVFLAGSIEMGKAEEWQDIIYNQCKEQKINVTLLNPRRDDWDNSWEQSINNDNFRNQVEWELTNLRNADKIIFYFDPNTKSPISLLELGMYASSRKLCVYCPEGFWRKGNVDIVCKWYNIPMVNSFEEMVEFIKA